MVSLTPFGAFAQIIPGVDGLIHISQISMERINKPADALQIGQEVDAKITELDIDRITEAAETFQCFLDIAVFRFQYVLLPVLSMELEI